MNVTLPPALNQLVDRLVHTGRYADEGDVVREALRALERQEFNESPALEAAILEGVASPHQPYEASAPPPGAQPMRGESVGGSAPPPGAQPMR